MQWHCVRMHAICYLWPSGWLFWHSEFVIWLEIDAVYLTLTLFYLPCVTVSCYAWSNNNNNLLNWCDVSNYVEYVFTIDVSNNLFMITLTHIFLFTAQFDLLWSWQQVRDVWLFAAWYCVTYRKYFSLFYTFRLFRTEFHGKSCHHRTEYCWQSKWWVVLQTIYDFQSKGILLLLNLISQ